MQIFGSLLCYSIVSYFTNTIYILYLNYLHDNNWRDHWKGKIRPKYILNKIWCRIMKFCTGASFYNVGEY